MGNPFVSQCISDICQIVGVEYLNGFVNIDMTSMPLSHPSTKEVSVFMARIIQVLSKYTIPEIRNCRVSLKSEVHFVGNVLVNFGKNL